MVKITPMDAGLTAVKNMESIATIARDLDIQHHRIMARNFKAERLAYGASLTCEHAPPVWWPPFVFTGAALLILAGLATIFM